MIRLYFASRPILTAFFARLAVGVLIVVDSSIAMKHFVLLTKRVAYSTPLAVLRASMFMTRILRSSVTSQRLSSSAFSAFLGDGVHNAIREIMCSGKCLGSSRFTQLRYTPLGAMTKALLICPLSYNIDRLLITIKLLPVPMSANKAATGRRQNRSKYER